ncbi:MAG TPA: FAD-dependent oxidoreductase [Solirubrobacteraceae bacterium]|nr:FAD-dependent oxidoreductase [Solirubrobacteraceae bacterium]
MSQSHSADVLVVGGGVIGLAVAWHARQRGMSVTVLERDATGRGTSHVAAGMLAPVAEVEFGDAGRRLLDLGLRSAEMWGGFAAELEAVAEMDIGLTRTGTLLLARDDDDARELERQLAFRESLGLAVERLRPSEAREREPALAPTVRLALEAPDDHSVDPRLVLQALRRVCDARGVDIREHSPVASVELDGEPVHIAGEEYAASEERNARGAHVVLRGVALANGERLSAPRVVLAAGPWTADIAGLPAHARVPVRPVKGQILRLRDPAGPGLLQRVLRFHGGYVVPRGDGRYVLGATVEERGFSLQPTVGPIYELLRDAHELLPGISELDIEELSVGLRPCTPDNAPVIGPGAVHGLVWATGHHRNGILLAPLTAQLVAAALAGEDMPAPLLSACAAERFTGAAHSPRPHAVGPPVGAV